MTRDETARSLDQVLSAARSEPAEVDVEDAVSLLSSPGAVDRDGLVSAVAGVVRADPVGATDPLRAALHHDDPAVRSAAATVAGRVAAERPAPLSDVTSALVDRLDDEAVLPRINATHALVELAPHAPDAVAEGVPTLAAHLESELPNLRGLAGECLLATARTEPGPVGPAVPDLLAVVESDAHGDPATETTAGASGAPTSRRSSPVRERTVAARTDHHRLRAVAAETVSSVAQVEPAAVPLDDRLLDALAADVPVPVRRWCVDTVSALARADADRCSPAIDPLVRVVGDDGASLPVRGLAAEALAHCAEVRFIETTDAARPVLSDLGTLLCDDDATARAGSAALLTYLAERFPGETTDARPALRTALDAESDPVRARAAFALGFVAGDEARSALTDLRASDPSEAVRESAAAALEASAPDPDS